MLRKLDVPLVPVILGVLLGNAMETNLRRALTISDGDWSVLWGSPLAIGIWTLAIVGVLLPTGSQPLLPARRSPTIQVDEGPTRLTQEPGEPPARRRLLRSRDAPDRAGAVLADDQRTVLGDRSPTGRPHT